jgi:hypothetical protein
MAAGDYLANAISLGLLVLLPLILLVLSGSYLRETEDGGTSGYALGRLDLLL